MRTAMVRGILPAILMGTTFMACGGSDSSTTQDVPWVTPDALDAVTVPDLPIDTAKPDIVTDLPAPDGQICWPNEKACQNMQLKTCNATGTGWVFSDCPNGCENSACVKICTPNEAKCVSDTLVTCSADGLQETSKVCATGCANNKCNGSVCNSGAKRCSPTSPLQPQQCKGDETGWENLGTPCENACVNGFCQQYACDTGDLQCSNDETSIQQCKADRMGWELKEVCPEGCIVHSGDTPICAQCPEDGRRCNGNVPEVCDPLSGWATQSECEEDYHCAVGRCLEVCELSEDDIDFNYLVLANYLAYCWADYGAGNMNQLCFVIDSTYLPDAILDDGLIDWFCEGVDDGTVTTLDFDSDALFEAAEDMFACGFLEVRNLSFETNASNIPTYSGFNYCISMNADSKNEVYVDECDDYLDFGR